MVTDKTRRSAFIEQNLGLVHAVRTLPGQGQLNTMISTALAAWDWSRRPTALMKDAGSAFLPMQCQ